MSSCPPISRLFQSTLSMRRATFGLDGTWDVEPISIHALHEESDLLIGCKAIFNPYFNPRSP